MLEPEVSYSNAERTKFDPEYIKLYIETLIKYMSPEDRFDYYRKVLKVYEQLKKRSYKNKKDDRYNSYE